MRLYKLRVHNIRSYQNQEIVFPTGSILLSGDVGAGKTTLLLAIEFALFGLQPGQRGSSLLTTSEDEGTVELECEINSTYIIIKRTLRRSTKGVAQDTATLTINGASSEMSVTELKTRVLELLGYPDEFVKKTNLLYRYTVYSPQEEMKQIVLEDPETRLNLLRHIFGIDKYRRINENVELLALVLREHIKESQGEVKDLEHYRLQKTEQKIKIEGIDEKITQVEKRCVEKKEIRKKIELDYTELDSRKTEKVTLEKEVEKTHFLRQNKKQIILDADKDIKILQEKIKIPLFEKPLYEQIIITLKEKQASMEKNRTLLLEKTAQLAALTRKKEEDIEKRKRVFSIDICPTCLQDVPEFHKHNILNETESQIAQVEREVILLSEQQKMLKKELEKDQYELKVLEQKKSELELIRVKEEGRREAELKIQELTAKKALAEQDMKALDEHMARLKESLLTFSTFEVLIKKKDLDLRKAFQEEKLAEIEFAEVRKEKEFLLLEQTRIQQEIARKEAQQKRIADISNLEQWLAVTFTELISRVEQNIMLRVRDEFSRLFNKWFAMLTTDAFYVRLDENFTPIVMQHEYELDYEFLSGGERTAVALAYRLALNQIINSIHSKINTNDIIILDEPTDGFSEQQLDRMRDILHELGVAQLIMVSHEPKIESFVDTVIKIRKENGFSIKD